MPCNSPSFVPLNQSIIAACAAAGNAKLVQRALSL